MDFPGKHWTQNGFGLKADDNKENDGEKEGVKEGKIRIAKKEGRKSNIHRKIWKEIQKCS